MNLSILFSAFFYMFGQSFCTTWYMHRAFTVSVAVAVFVLPFSFFKRMDSLTFVRFVHNRELLVCYCVA